MSAHKTFRIKRKLAKKLKQNRPIPQWVRMRTDNTISIEDDPHPETPGYPSFPGVSPKVTTPHLAPAPRQCIGSRSPNNRLLDHPPYSPDLAPCDCGLS
ncbi:hypothetical protein C0J52_21766 [Blattella germanica]|nr:hypothetical protein C0J52_21766 [Blattella germanica]